MKNKVAGIFIAMVHLGMFASADVQTKTWDNMAAPGGNTPREAYDWTSYWTGGGYPSSFGEGADFGGNVSYPRFIRIADGVALSYLKWGDGNHFLGDLIFGDTDDGTSANHAVNSGSIIYGDFYNNSMAKPSYIGAFSIAGRFYAPATNPKGRAKTYSSWYRTGDLTIRMDLFAENTNPVRTPPMVDSGSQTANASFCFYGPRGCDALTGSCDQVENSPYLKLLTVSGSVAPGSVVSGEGIPNGAFVKYVFGTTGWIQLSQNVGVTKNENAIAFSAITPSVEQCIYYERGNTGSAINGVRFRAIKYREEDGCRLVFREIEAYGDSMRWRKWGLMKDEIATGLIPGDIVISNMVIASGANSPASNTLYCARLELPNVLVGGAWNCDSECDSRLTVPEGRTGGFGLLYGIDGVIEKRGAGILSLCMGQSHSRGTLRIAAGTVLVSNSVSIASETIEIANLELTADATLILPKEGLVVSTLKAAAGAKVVGPGKLTVLTTPKEIPAACGGAEIVIPIVALTAADVFPASSRILHFDASAEGTVTTNENGGVTSWSDADGGVYSVERYNTRTTGNFIGGNAALRLNAVNGLPMVDMGDICWTNAGPGKSTLIDRSLIFTKDGSQITQASSGPSLKTCFFVVGSEYGGGSLLGARGPAFPNYGIPHNVMVPNAGIVSAQANQDWSLSKFADAGIDDGSMVFRTNGVSCYPRTTPFSKGFDVISFTRDTAVQGNGLGFYGELDSESYGRTANGLLYGEVVGFEDRLSGGEIAKAEMYLLHKWLGQEYPGYFSQTVGKLFADADAKITVSGGGEVITSWIGGSGTITGEVTLSADGVVAVATRGDRTVKGMVVNGRLSLAGAGKVYVDETVAKVAPGEYEIVSANSITGTVDSWTLVFSRGKAQGRIYIKDGKLCLSVVPNGLLLVVE